VTGHVNCGGILVDGLGVGDVGNIVLKDRQRLAEDGILVVVLTVSGNGELISGPDIVSRGFVYVRESEELMDEAQEVVEDAVDNAMNKKGVDWTRIKNAIRDDLSDFLWKRTKRSPMILPILMEAEA
jgi:ribonuclease J